MSFTAEYPALLPPTGFDARSQQIKQSLLIKTIPPVVRRWINDANSFSLYLLTHVTFDLSACQSPYDYITASAFCQFLEKCCHFSFKTNYPNLGFFFIFLKQHCGEEASSYSLPHFHSESPWEPIRTAACVRTSSCSLALMWFLMGSTDVWDVIGLTRLACVTDRQLLTVTLIIFPTYQICSSTSLLNEILVSRVCTQFSQEEFYCLVPASSSISNYSTTTGTESVLLS